MFISFSIPIPPLIGQVCDPNACNNLLTEESFENLVGVNCTAAVTANNAFNLGCIPNWIAANGTPDVFDGTLINNGITAIEGDNYAHLLANYWDGYPEVIALNTNILPFRIYSISFDAFASGYGTSGTPGIQVVMVNNNYVGLFNNYQVGNNAPAVIVTDFSFGCIDDGINGCFETLPQVFTTNMITNSWQNYCFTTQIAPMEIAVSSPPQPLSFEQLLFVPSFGGSAASILIDHVEIGCQLNILNPFLATSPNQIDYQFTPQFSVPNFPDALTYAWDFGDGNTSTQVMPTHTFTESGTYNVCLDISDNIGCCEITCDSITVVIPPPPICSGTSPTSINIDTDGADINLSDLIIQTGLDPIMLSGAHIYLDANLIIDVPYRFINCNFYCEAGSKITNNNMSTSTSTAFIGGTFEGCEYMWQGIENNGRLFIYNNHILDAENGVDISNGNYNYIAFNTFDKNYIGIRAERPTISGLTHTIRNNEFYCTDILKPAYTGQQNYPDNFNNPNIPDKITYAGISMHNIDNTNIRNSTAQGIRNGIIINGGSASISNSSFSGLLGSNTDLNDNILLQSGLGIYCNSTVNTTAFKNTFDNLMVGLYYTNAVFGNNNLDENTFSNINHFNASSAGINITRAIKSNFDINDNVGLSNLKKGIRFFGGSIFLLFIRDNSLNITGSRAVGIEILDTDIIREAFIESNTMTMNVISGTGLQLSRTNNCNVYDNIINHFPSGNFGFTTGISSLACEDIDIRSNSLSGFGNTYAGMSISLSSGNYYCCNSINGGKVGMRFSGTCPNLLNTRANINGTAFNGNTIGLQLYNATIDQQPHGGNIWTGTGSRAEMLISGSPSSLDYIASANDNKFTVNPNQTGMRPANISPAAIAGQQWFGDETDESASTCAQVPNCGGNIDAINPTNEDGDGYWDHVPWPDLIGPGEPVIWCNDPFIQYLISLASSTPNGYNPFGDNETWDSQYYLYELLIHSNPIYWSSCPQLVAFMNNATVIASYYAVDQAINNAYALTLSEATMVDYTLPLLSQDIDAVNALYDLVSNENDLITYEPQINTLNASITSRTSLLMNIKNTVVSRAATQMNGLMPSINTLPVLHSHHHTMKQVYLMKAKAIRDGYGALTTADFNLLQGIAAACPLLDGKEVYTARAMVSLIADVDYADIEDICEATIPKNRNLDKSDDEETALMVYPNPSSGQYTVILPTSGEQISFEIVDLMGRSIFTKQVTRDDSREQMIDISEHNAGVYYLYVRKGEDLIATQKMIMIK